MTPPVLILGLGSSSLVFCVCEYARHRIFIWVGNGYTLFKCPDFKLVPLIFMMWVTDEKLWAAVRLGIMADRGRE